MGWGAHYKVHVTDEEAEAHRGLILPSGAAAEWP